MGGADKALIRLGDMTLLDRVCERLRPQVARLALSANGDPARFQGFSGPVLADRDRQRLGPMAGIRAGLDWLAATDGRALVSVSVDTPFLPADLVRRLVDAADRAQGFALASSRGRIHPTCGIWPLRLRAALAADLAGGERRIGLWSQGQGAEIVEFTGEPDPFWNINTPDDLIAAERWLQG